jgi:hypothetical protein
VLLSRERIPTMLLLLVLGAIVAIMREPGLPGELGRLSLRFHLPSFALAALRWKDLATGVVVLGLSQAALTLGNAIVATVSTVSENNALFPDRRITVRTVAIDHGIVNLVGSSLGGVLMCHGAGGLAGHVRFGARTGGAMVMLGVLALFTGLFLAESVAVLFKLFPPSLLGVILLFGGLELAAGAQNGATARRIAMSCSSPQVSPCGTWALDIWPGSSSGMWTGGGGRGHE